MTVSDEVVTNALRRLWQPFQEADDTHPQLEVRVEQLGSNWQVDAGSRGQELFGNRWGVVDRVSSEIFQAAVRNPGQSLDLHAAVLAYGSECILLVGTTGAGKSTLCLRLLESDGSLSYGSDDLAPISPDATIKPFPKPLVLKDPDLWDEFGARELELVELGRPEGTFLIAADRYPAPITTSLVPSAIVFLDYRPGKLELVELPAAQAVLECGRYVSKLDQERLRMVKKVCSGARCVRLNYPSWQQAVERLLRFGFGEEPL